MLLEHSAFSESRRREVGLQKWVALYVIKKPWLRTEVSGVKNSTLRAFYKKPGNKQSKTCVLDLLEQIEGVHDGPRTMIGIKECESNGQIATELDCGRGIKGECSLC